jgi:streptogramin lyase
MRVGVLGCAFIASVSLLAQQPIILEYSIPTDQSLPGSIAQGPDGNLWFTETAANKIGNITPLGLITEYAIPTPNSRPNGIAQGSDGNLWFTEPGSNQIGKITPNGFITEYPLSSSPWQITAGPDGNLWFTGATSKISKITISGVVTEYQVRTASSPVSITQGSDGNLWFTESYRVGKITPDGLVTEYSLSDSPLSDYDRQLDAIALGSDGNVWATGGGATWRIGMTGASTFYKTPSPYWGTQGIASGLNGSLWFTELYGNNVARITTDGVIHEYAIPTPEARPNGIVQGPDGNIWFTEQGGNKIGVIVSSSLPVDPLLILSSPSLSFSANAEPQVLSVSSAVPATFQSYASSAGPWLNISPSDGLHTDQQIVVSVNLARLPPNRGVLTGAISLTSGDVTQTVPVTFNLPTPTPD